MKRSYRNNKRNFCGGAVAGFVGGPDFFRFLTFYPFADKKSIVSSYFIVEKRVFCRDIQEKGARSFVGITERRNFKVTNF